MSRLRFSIAQLMGIVILIGFGFAALRNANDVWASATFGAAIVTVALGLAERSGTEPLPATILGRPIAGPHPG